MGMNTDLARGFARAASALAFLAWIPLAIGAQEAKNEEKKPKESPDSAKIAEWKAEAEARTLFKSEEALAITLTANYRNISRDRDTLSIKEYWGEISMAGPAGDTVKYPVMLRTRGHFRLASRNCSFVPLRVDFKKGDMKGTVFEGQDKLKLITHCNSTGEYDKYMLREYLAYKVHNAITPRSHRARLLRVTYVDSASGKPVDTKNAIFLEHEDDVAKRMEGEVVEIRRALFDDVDFHQMNEVALFEYFISNHDWSLYALHNIKLVRKLDGTILPIMYDLDHSGLVNARYANPPPQLNLRSVRQRLYRGPCRALDELEPQFENYRKKEAEVLKLYDNFPGLDSRYAKETQQYLGEFFKMLKSPRDIKAIFVDGCKKQPSV